MQHVLWFKIKKNWKDLDFSFFVGDVKIGLGFRPFWPRLPGPGPQNQEAFLAQVFNKH